MDNSQQTKPDASPYSGASLISDFFFYSIGRHGVRVFGVPSEYLVMAAIATFLFGIPVAVLVGVFPFWEYVGNFGPIRFLHSWIAPGIDQIGYQFRADSLQRFPLKRFMVAAACMIELTLLFSFATLFSRRVRKHALLVWECYDRETLLKYLFATGAIFLILWYFLFVDWRPLAFLLTRGLHTRGPGWLFCGIAGFPIVAFLFGHIAAIVAMGAWHTLSRKLSGIRNGQ
jgi:hypothetical protein